MGRKRVPTGLSGVLVVDKPAGVTSHDVVTVVRRATGERRVGHAGTLDPMATGLLVVLLGPATRLAQYLTAEDKAYEATVTFGSETDSADADGEVIATAPVPALLTEGGFAQDAVASLVGRHLQIPPGHSAIKIEGRKAYELARKGEVVELEPREIEILAAELVTIHPGPPLAWRIFLEVSKGTYVRSVARDLGRSLGTVAHLTALRRTRSGMLEIAEAHTLSDVEDAARGGRLERLVADPAQALGLPCVMLTEEQAADVANGKRLEAPAMLAVEEDALVSLVSLVSPGRLLAVYRREQGVLLAETVLPGGVPGIGEACGVGEAR